LYNDDITKKVNRPVFLAVKERGAGVTVLLKFANGTTEAEIGTFETDSEGKVHFVLEEANTSEYLSLNSDGEIVCF